MYSHVLPCIAMYSHIMPCTSMYSHHWPWHRQRRSETWDLKTNEWNVWSDKLKCSRKIYNLSRKRTRRTTKISWNQSEQKEIHVNPETNTNPTLQNNHFYLLSVNTAADIVLHEDESPVTFYIFSPNIYGEEHENTSNAWPNNIQENE